MIKNYFLISAILIVLGFVSIPMFPDGMARQSDRTLGKHLTSVAITITPFLPLVLVAIRGALQFPADRRATIIFSILIVGFGGFLTLLVAAFSGAGSSIVFLKGFALTAAISASILFLSTDKGLTDHKSFAGRIMIFPSLVAVWSLASVMAATVHANFLSDGRPFCIATHSPSSAINSFAQLRGLSFFTTASGYKSTSRWYFHGLLIVDDGTSKEIYNWSPRRMHFDRIERPNLQFANPALAFTPKDNFWKSVSVL